MADYRISKSENFAPLHQAIGEVAAAAAHSQQALLQLAADVSGSSMVYFPMQDATLQPQIKSVRQILEHLNTNPYIVHAPVHDEHKRISLRLVRALEGLVPFRNRVIHDTWTPWHDPSVPDAIEGRHATRWSSEIIQSDIRSFRVLSRLFADFGAACTGVEMSLSLFRNTGVVEPGAQATEPLRRLETGVQGAAQGSLDGFRWIREKRPA